jgi:hypothetical protein
MEQKSSTHPPVETARAIRLYYSHPHHFTEYKLTLQYQHTSVPAKIEQLTFSIGHTKYIHSVASNHVKFHFPRNAIHKLPSTQDARVEKHREVNDNEFYDIATNRGN